MIWRTGQAAHCRVWLATGLTPDQASRMRRSHRTGRDHRSGLWHQPAPSAWRSACRRAGGAAVWPQAVEVDAADLHRFRHRGEETLPASAAPTRYEDHRHTLVAGKLDQGRQSSPGSFV